MTSSYSDPSSHTVVVFQHPLTLHLGEHKFYELDYGQSLHLEFQNGRSYISRVKTKHHPSISKSFSSPFTEAKYVEPETFTPIASPKSSFRGYFKHTGHFLWSAHHSTGVTGGGVVRGYTRAGQVVDVTVPGPRGFAPRT